MLDLPDLTLVAIYTVAHELTEMAVAECTRHVRFGDVKLFTNRPLRSQSHGVARPGHLGALQPRDAAQERELDVERQRGRDPVGIHLPGSAQPDLDALGLEEDLVALFVRKPDDLVLDARAVARPGALDVLAIQG